MRDAWRHFRAAVGEFYFELPRMIAVSLIWFIPTIPALWVAFRVVTFIGEDPGADGDVLIPMVAFGIQATFFGFLSLVAAGPALAGLAGVDPRNHRCVHRGRAGPQYLVLLDI
ncbi:MAG: hypothetical protein EBT00_04910 [Proteobacteria bacterium]|nr:hypothetical protein [Pseudomonadota bacterium]